jgi:putative ABC transport system ATP-binding protein
MKILEVQHVVKTYGSYQNQVTALSDVSFAAEQGEFIAIVGTSGSGKSTLLNLLGGLDVPTEGKISIRGHDIGSLTRKEQTIFRRRNIGFVFQNYSLMPVLNVYDNVALPVTFDKGSHVDREHIRELLNELGLWEKRKRYPSAAESCNCKSACKQTCPSARRRTDRESGFQNCRGGNRPVKSQQSEIPSDGADGDTQ